MTKLELINYNRLFWLDNDKLLKIFYSSNDFLSIIAKRILIDDNRLIDEDIDVIIKFLNKINIEDRWNLASKNSDFVINKLAKRMINDVIDNTFAKDVSKVKKFDLLF